MDRVRARFAGRREESNDCAMTRSNRNLCSAAATARKSRANAPRARADYRLAHDARAAAAAKHQIRS
eukprot:4402607-Lingulodinium_polyedra.AAC.1